MANRVERKQDGASPPGKWAELERRAKAEAARTGVPAHKTKAFKKLQASCYAALAREGFVDIEFEDPRTGEPGDMLRGLNTAQLLAMGGPHPGRVRDSGKVGLTAGVGYHRGEDTEGAGRAVAARDRMEAQAEWFELLRDEVPKVAARWPRSPWRSRSMALYADGFRFDEIARTVGRRRSEVKAAICNELRRIRKEQAERRKR